MTYFHTQSLIPNELDTEDTADTAKYDSYLNLHLDIKNGGRLKPDLITKGMTFVFQLLTNNF